MSTPDLAYTTWRKSSYSTDEANCVEIATSPGLIGVRDTKDRDGGTLTLAANAWSAFLHEQR